MGLDLSFLAQRKQNVLERWFLNRQIVVDDYFMGMTIHVSRNEDDMVTYWIECMLADGTRVISTEHTAWQTAFLGSNMSCLYSTLRRGFLDTGPNAKRCTRHGQK